MAASFIGKPISLISHSDVRYRGILAGIDPAASTIQLSNVFSMGTESRRPPDQFIPPVQEPYAYIIFRASEVKDLAVDDPTPPRRSVHDDPAVLGASAPVMGTSPYMPYQQPYQPPPPVPQVAPQHPVASPQPPRQQPYTPLQTPAQPSVPQQQAGPAIPAQPPQGAPSAARSAQGSRNGRNNAVHSATASLETVERALGDLRVSNVAANGSASPRSGGRRGRGGQEIKAGDIRVPATDFDFQSSNARFDKAALLPRGAAKEKADKAEDGEAEEKDGEKKASANEEEEIAYDPKKSFFDSLSSGSNGPSADLRGGRGGRRGGGRNRREEERERNVATFGEPGGIGLMGPGQYVGGWGGYGRRGGAGRGRRGPGAAAAVTR